MSTVIDKLTAIETRVNKQRQPLTREQTVSAILGYKNPNHSNTDVFGFLASTYDRVVANEALAEVIIGHLLAQGSDLSAEQITDAVHSGLSKALGEVTANVSLEINPTATKE